MRFDQPVFLLLLIGLIPLFIFAKKIKSPSLLFSRLKATDGPKKSKNTKLILELIGLSLLIIALAKPQLGSSHVETKAKGIDIMIALDISYSMNGLDAEGELRKELEAAYEKGQKNNVTAYYNEKVAKQFRENTHRSRLKVAIEKIREFIKKRPNDRIGLIAFGRNAYTVSPPTLDHKFLDERIKRLDIKKLNEEESFTTSIEAPITTATLRLQDAESKRRILLLLSDGAHSPNLGGISPEEAANQAKANDLSIYSIAIGDKLTLYLNNNGLVIHNNAVNFNLLESISDITDGQFFWVKNSQSMQKAMTEIDGFEKTEFTRIEHKDYLDLYPYFMLSGLILFLITFLTYSVIRLPVP